MYNVIVDGKKFQKETVCVLETPVERNKVLQELLYS